MKKTGAQILCESLVREGVEVMFGFPGGAVLPLYDTFPEYPKIRHILVRHEQAAAHAADAYARATGVASVRSGFHPLDEEGLRRRGQFGLTRRQQFQIVRQHLRLVPSVFCIARRRPIPLVLHEPVRTATSPPANYPATRSARLEPDEYSALRAVAARREVSSNDLLIHALFLALADWQSRNGEGHSEAWRRIWIPVNLRTLAQRRLPAANITSIVFLDRHSRDLAEPDRLMAGIHREMQAVKDLRIGMFLVNSMRVLKFVTGSVRAMVRDDRCAATCVLSNMGAPFAHAQTAKRDGRILLGEAVLEDVEMIAPLRPYTCANLCVFEYAGRLWFTLHYDPRPLTEAQAEDLLQTFLRYVRAGS